MAAVAVLDAYTASVLAGYALLAVIDGVEGDAIGIGVVFYQTPGVIAGAVADVGGVGFFGLLADFIVLPGGGEGFAPSYIFRSLS